MSGIAGIFRLDDRPVETEWLQRMAEAAPYRGTDGAGIWTDGPVGFLHQKNIVTPEDVADNQPRRNPATATVLTVDGVIFNREELYAELPERSRPAPDAPDSAYVLAAFDTWGERCPGHLHGDWAFAVWDERERRLFCARSLKGWKPFLWWSDRRTFAFASETSQLFTYPDIPQRINEGYVGEFLAFYPTSMAETLWEGVQHLPPGCAMSVAADNRREWRWHDCDYPEIRYRDERDYVEHFRELFAHAIKVRLRSVAPVAADLSGGLDSSSVVCMAAEMHRRGDIDRPPRSVSAVFPGEPHDESSWIDMVCERTGHETRRLTPPPYDWEHWRRWSRECRDTPLRPNAAIGRTIRAWMRDEGIRVNLTGEGGDDWYRGSTVFWIDLARQGRFRHLWDSVRENAREPLSAPRTALAVARGGVLPLLWPARQRRAIYGLNRYPREIPAWISPEWARAIDLRERINRFPPMTEWRGAYHAWLAYTNLYWRSPIYDSIQRLNEMHGVEYRHPFLDENLIRFVFGVPASQVRAHGEKKSLLRRAMRGILPDQIRTRQTKTFFTGPIEAAHAAARQSGWLPSLKQKTWLDIPALDDPNTPLLAVWNAVAIDTWLSEAVTTSRRDEA